MSTISVVRKSTDGFGGLGLIALGAWLARAPARSANDASTRGSPFASRAR